MRAGRPHARIVQYPRMRAGRRPAYVAPRATPVARSLFERRTHAARGWNRFDVRRVM